MRHRLRSVLAPFFSFLATAALIVFLWPAYAGAFSVGDRIVVVSGPWNVRATPSTSGTSLGTQTTGAKGTVAGGPTTATGYTWYNVNFDNAPSGWIVQNGLSLAPQSAQINSYMPNSKLTVQPGNSFTLTVYYSNTGSAGANFIPGVTIWNSSGGQVYNGLGSSSYVAAGAQANNSWTTSLNTPGDYFLQFGVWNADQSTLLAKAPLPSQNLVTLVAVTRTLTVTSSKITRRSRCWLHQRRAVTIS